jgi:hypothetical protein
LLSPTAAQGDAARIERQALTTYFAKNNDAGGIFGRRMELLFLDLPEDTAQRADAVRGFLREKQIFAAIGDMSGAEGAIAGVMREQGVPMIAILASFPETGLPLNRFVFYLDGGIEDEAQALMDFSAVRMQEKGRHVAIVCGKDALSRETALWLKRHLSESGAGQVPIDEDRIPPLADVVYWVRPVSELASILDVPAMHRTILVPGGFSGAELKTVAARNAEMFVALTARSGNSGTGSRLLWERVVASASILNEGIKLSGRELKRAGMIEALEGFQKVQTALPEPISYSTSRRIGASDVHIMRFDSSGQKLEAVDDTIQSQAARRR